MIRKIKAKLVKFVNFLGRITVFLSCLSFSAIIYVNSAETLLQTDLPIVNAVSTFKSSSIFSDYDFAVLESSTSLNGNVVGDFGKPIVLHIPTADKRIEIVPAIVNDNNWLARPNSAHILGYGKENNFISLLYLKKSWRTVNNSETISVGTNIYIDTNRQWRYVFEVEEISTSTHGQKFVLSETNKPGLFLLLEDGDRTEIFRAEYRTALSIQQ